MTFPHLQTDFPNVPEKGEWNVPDWHAVYSVVFGQLVENGWFDPEDETWTWDSYSEAQYARVMQKVIDRYYYREISLLPLARWKREFLRKLNESMPKYKLLYAEIDKGIDILADGARYGKSRDVFSDFPQTALGGNNQDYASTGTDRQYEDISQGSTVDSMERAARAYRDVDVMILDELEVLFNQMLTMYENGF